MLADLVAQRRILICVGSGGVGKTTTAASLAVAGAQAGRETLVLTIDPARRLANALGLSELDHQVREISPERLAQLPGGAPRARLHAMMLDQKRGFDEVVTRYAKDEASQARIFGNRIYQQMSATISGSHEYAAMAKLYEIAASDRYQLIVLDTPPTANALDFLDAPQRMADAIDSPAVQWLVRAAGKSSLRAVGLGAAFVLRRLARFVGSKFLSDIGEFLTEASAVLAGFRERAQEVYRILRTPDVAFVLVSSAEPASVDEVLFFQRRLVASEMPLGAFVVNRVHPLGPKPLDPDNLKTRLSARAEMRGFTPNELEHFANDLRTTYDEFQTLGSNDAAQVARLAAVAAQMPVVQVPFFDHDVYDIRSLGHMIQYLVGATS